MKIASGQKATQLKLKMIFRQLFDKISSTYTYLIASAKGREALIIDPVLENVDQYIKLLNQLDLKLVKVIDTHIHADHISGIAELRDKTNCVTVMGDKTPADVVAMRVSDEENIKIDGIDLKAIYTPGHTSESFSFLMGDRVFTGDALLIRGTGRTDFQNGDPKDSYNSIFNKLLKLPEETLVYPAHDYKGETVSTIFEEKKFNPRLQVNSVEEYVEIMNNLNLPVPSMYEYLDKNKDKLKDKRILFYCAHGHRSTLAVQISKSYNFTNCCHLIGGLKNWKKEGLGLS